MLFLITQNKIENRKYFFYIVVSEMSHSLSSFYASMNSENPSTNGSLKKSSNVCYTLPLTCQICLGRRRLDSSTMTYKPTVNNHF